VFRNFFTPKMQVQRLVTFCTEVMGLSRFAVLYPDETYGRTFMNVFWDALIQAGGNIVGAEAYDPEMTDFAGPIRRLAARRRTTAGGTVPIVDFQALFIPDAPKKVGLILPQLTYHDVTGILLMGTNLWYSQSLMDMGRQYAQGAIIPLAFFPQSTSERVRAFVTRFESVFGETPEFIEAAAFDTTLMVLEAASDPRVGSRKALKDLLHAFRGFSGVSGPAYFDETGEVVRILQLVQVKGDRFVEIGSPMDAGGPEAR
jgi:ABC-type branched-subunit amino acid transport system substrate-binding protein